MLSLHILQMTWFWWLFDTVMFNLHADSLELNDWSYGTLLENSSLGLEEADCAQ